MPTIRVTPFSVMGAGGPRGLIYRREPFVRVIIAYMARIDQGRTLTSSRKSWPFVTQGADDLERHGGASDRRDRRGILSRSPQPRGRLRERSRQLGNDLADTPLLLGCHCPRGDPDIVFDRKGCSHVCLIAHQSSRIIKQEVGILKVE